MISIKNCHFEGVKSGDLGGVITNTGNNEVLIECASFFDTCSSSGSSSSSGAVYKKNGILTMIKTEIDFCWTTAVGNNMGGSVLFSDSSVTNISMCSISHSSYKMSSQVADSPLAFSYPLETSVSLSNFTNNNGNDVYGNTFAELSYNKKSITEYNNFVNGSAKIFTHYYRPKETSYMRKCNVLDMVINFIFDSDALVTVSWCAFFGNSKGTLQGSYSFQNCWSDDSRIDSPTSAATKIYIDNINLGCQVYEICSYHFNLVKSYKLLSMFCIPCTLSCCRVAKKRTSQ